MQLLTEEIKANLPKLCATENTPIDKKEIVAKFFNPLGTETWYVVEGEEDGDWLFFGLAEITDAEWGYFSLSQLKSVKLPFGMGIERDLYFG